MTIGDGHDLKSSRFAGDEVLEACYDNERFLSKGDSGASVEKVQQALIALDFPIPEVGANGIFGIETDLAVRSYQESRKLTVDGVIGAITIKSLDEEFLTVAPEPLGPPLSEPKMSDVSTPLNPESPVAPPRAPPVSAPKVGAPIVKTPRAPFVGTPRAPIVEPPTAPVVEPPILTTQTVPRDQEMERVTRPITPPITRLPNTVDSQGRKFHTAGTLRGSRAFEAEAGSSVRLELNNLNVRESTVTIKTNSGETREAVLVPNKLVDFEFSMGGQEAYVWKFYIETDNDDSLIEWKLYSNWIPGEAEETA